jgi:RNA polymerase sigma factor (sigma-70 family)
LSETELIELVAGCRKQDLKAQKKLYEHFAARMLGVCRRYISGREDAEDVMVEALFRVFDRIESYNGNGSFEGWVRRIVVNEALMFLRKRRLLTIETDIADLNTRQFSEEITVENHLQAQDILNLLHKLPTGYRTVFNLFVIEGFKHIEIAEMLEISINTSKSQLILAKEKMRKELSKVQ